MVYFILNRELNHVKIGYTKELYKRLSSLQTGNSVELEIIHVIPYYTMNEEYYLHQYFSSLLIKNEWFSYGSAIKHFIWFSKFMDYSTFTMLNPPLDDTAKENGFIRYLKFCADSFRRHRATSQVHFFEIDEYLSNQQFK